MHTLLLLSLNAVILFLLVYGAGNYAWTVLVSAIPLALAAFLTACRTPGHVADGETHRSLYPAIFMVIIGFIVLTLLPLPKPLTIVTGANRYSQNQTAAEVLESAASLGVCECPRLFFSTTRNRAGSLRVLALLILVFGAFEAVRLLPSQHRQHFVHLLILIGCVVAVLGYLSSAVYPQGNRLWWWFHVPPFPRKPVGGFFNANHYAGFIAMLSVTSLGAAIADFRKRHWLWSSVALGAALTMAVCVVLSASRGAILAWTAGVMMLTVITASRLRGRLRIGGFLVISIAILVGAAAMFQNDNARARMSTLRHPVTDSSVQPRLSAWKGALRLWTHYPLIGAGANAFRFTYPQHKDAQHRAYRRFAENEVLHILAEGGIVGLALAGALIVSVVRLLKRRVLSASNESGIAICSVAALIVGLVHGSVDFILHLPLYSMTLASILALGTEYTAPSSSRKSAIAAALFLALLLIPLTVPMSKYDSSGYIPTASAQRVASLLTWAPTNPQLWRRFGAVVSRQKTAETARLAERCLEVASQYDPCNFNVWIQLGKRRLACGDRQGAQEAFDRATAIRSWAPVPKLPEE